MVSSRSVPQTINADNRQPFRVANRSMQTTVPCRVPLRSVPYATSFRAVPFRSMQRSWSAAVAHEATPCCAANQRQYRRRAVPLCASGRKPCRSQFRSVLCSWSAAVPSSKPFRGVGQYFAPFLSVTIVRKLATKARLPELLLANTKRVQCITRRVCCIFQLRLAARCSLRQSAPRGFAEHERPMRARNLQSRF